MNLLRITFFVLRLPLSPNRVTITWHKAVKLNVLVRVMLKKPELDKRPVQINANGRPVAYLDRFPEFWIMRWVKKKIWGKHRFWR